MNMEFWKRLGCLLAVGTLAFVSGCSDRVAGGGSSGTETGNALTATILQANGTPSARAIVRLRPSDFLSGDTISARFTTQTNDSGKLRIDSVPKGDYTLEVISGMYSTLRTLSLSTSDSNIALGMDTLQKAATIVGHVPTTLPVNSTIFIVGTEHHTTVDANGAFKFDTIPVGSFELKVKADSVYSSYVETNSNAATSAGVLHAENSSSILLDDFEDGDSRNRLGPFVGEGWWWLDASQGVSIASTNPGQIIPIVYDGSTHGNVVHFNFTIDSTAINPWVDFGVQLGIKNANYNMSCADSIIFYARGTASGIVALSYAPPLDTFSRPSFAFTTKATWTRIAIALSSLTSNNGIYPKNYLQHITQVSWVFTTSADFWIDDVSIHGCSRAQIWGK